MPMSRYEIRNEYSLADPELYRAADKDDPESLLEGVAMAGLVGVLRQLGDLAEFAAEIFHNLHEDVMATASRGHALAFRIQQLEMEIPSVEIAFLSQTDHASFFFHPGDDWHPNVRVDNNLVTQGDMPRFIMDSYEECRAPPRLFLLDKFDVAGAGACLKRYSDPSFFKVETSEMTSADMQREKKIRKAKKKGPRWRNRENQEVLPTSHTKLHQLFLEERVENGISAASHRAKLKRRLNGFPFNSKSGESYMEKILKSPSPDHNVLRDMNVDSPQPKLATDDHKDFASEIFEVRPISPYRERRGGRIKTTPSPNGEDVAQNPPTYDSNESPLDNKIRLLPSSHRRVITHGISSTLDEVNYEKAVAVAESNRQGSLTGYESEDVAGEIENFVGAPSTMESEMDRDSDLRMKRNDTSPKIIELLVADGYEEPLHSRSSDSQSTGESMTSDAGNNSSTKEISSFSSDSPSISAEKPQSRSSSTKGFQCTAISVNEIVDALSYQETADEEFTVHQSKSAVSDDTLLETGSIPNLMHSDIDRFVRKHMLKPPNSDEKVSISEDGEQNTNPTIGPQCVVSDVITNQRSAALCINGSMPTLDLSDPGEVVGERESGAPRSDEMVCMTDDKDKMMNLFTIPPFSPSACISGRQSEDDLSSSSNVKQSVDQPNDEIAHFLSTAHDIYHHADGSVKTSPNFLREDESDGEDQELADDAVSTLNMPDVLSTNGSLDMMSSGKRIQYKFEDEYREVPENCRSYYPDSDGARSEDNVKPKGDNFTDVWDDEDSNVSTDSPNHSPSIMKASFEKGLEESSLATARTLADEDHHSNNSSDDEISLENLKLSQLTHYRDSPIEGPDAHDEDVIHEEDITVNETLPLGTPESCEVVGVLETGISYLLSPNGSEFVEISYSTSEDLEESAGVSDIVNDEILLFSGSKAEEVTEITTSADFQPANEIHGSEAHTSNTTNIISRMPAVSDDANLSKLVEVYNDCFEDSGIHELENDKNCPSEGELEDMEKVGLTETSALGVATTLCNTIHVDHPKSEVSGLVPKSHHDLESDHICKVNHAATIQSPFEQCGLVKEQELVNETGLKSHVPDAASLLIDIDTEESVQDEMGLLPAHLDQHLLQPYLSELSHSPPINLLENDDGKRESRPVSAFSLASHSSPPSVSELSRLSNNEISVPIYPEGPLCSIPPPSNTFPKANQINLSDLPPLPPLPPVQWRMGKLQQASSSAEEEIISIEESFPQIISPKAPTNDVGSTLSTKPIHNGSSPPTASTGDIISLREETRDSHTELASETISKEDNLELRSTFEAEILHETTTNYPPKIENKPHLLPTPIPKSVFASAAAENGIANGNQRVKFLCPRNPVVDDASFLDKSKLRKVTERVRPEVQKVEERDSLLEQIRTKSFNLKPAMASRPSIQARGPNTNLKVVAILEKANAIRQAFAGSDEEDDDSWSE